MVKEPCTKYRGVLISSHEARKLQSFQSGISDTITANVQNISLMVFLHIFVSFIEKELFT